MKRNPRPKWPLPWVMTDGPLRQNYVFVTRIRNVDIYQHAAPVHGQNRPGVTLVRGNNATQTVATHTWQVNWLRYRRNHLPESVIQMTEALWKLHS